MSTSSSSHVIVPDGTSGKVTHALLSELSATDTIDRGRVAVSQGYVVTLESYGASLKQRIYDQERHVANVKAELKARTDELDAVQKMVQSDTEKILQSARLMAAVKTAIGAITNYVKDPSFDACPPDLPEILAHSEQGFLFSALWAHIGVLRRRTTVAEKMRIIAAEGVAVDDMLKRTARGTTHQAPAPQTLAEEWLPRLKAKFRERVVEALKKMEVEGSFSHKMPSLGASNHVDELVAEYEKEGITLHWSGSKETIYVGFVVKK